MAYIHVVEVQVLAGGLKKNLKKSPEKFVFFLFVLYIYRVRRKLTATFQKTEGVCHKGFLITSNTE